MSPSVEESVGNGAATTALVIARTADTAANEAITRLNIEQPFWSGKGLVRLKRGTERRSVACGRAQKSGMS